MLMGKAFIFKSIKKTEKSKWPYYANFHVNIYIFVENGEMDNTVLEYEASLFLNLVPF